MLSVAKVALDHIKETPEGKSYYDALAQMEEELQETPEEEELEHQPGGEEEGGEIPAGEEAPFESKKVNESGEEEVPPAPETATNEEAQEMVDKGEAEIPAEAVVSEEEAAKE